MDKLLSAVGLSGRPGEPSADEPSDLLSGVLASAGDLPPTPPPGRGADRPARAGAAGLLEAHGARMLFAERAPAALALLERHPEVEAALVPAGDEDLMAEIHSRFPSMTTIAFAGDPAQWLDAIERALPPR